jgi:hypothetical protein
MDPEGVQQQRKRYDNLSAFRKENFMIGAYFSKPDWHSEYFWWPKYAPPDRNVNYDIRKYPWRWNQFKQYTYNQISEQMNNYGSIDILWLDDGWVQPLETVNAEVRSWVHVFRSLVRTLIFQKSQPWLAKHNRVCWLLIVPYTVRMKIIRHPSNAFLHNNSIIPGKAA